MKTLSFSLIIIIGLLTTGCQPSFDNHTIIEYLDSTQSMEESNALLEQSSRRLVWDIAEMARENLELKPLEDKAKAFLEIGKTLDTYIEQLKDSLLGPTNHLFLKDKVSVSQQISMSQLQLAKDKAIVEALFFSNLFNGTSQLPQATILDSTIQHVQHSYLDLLESCWERGGLPNTVFTQARQKDSMVHYLTQDLHFHGAQEAQNWDTFFFKNQPMAAALLTLTTIQNSIKFFEYTIVRFLKQQTTYGALVYDKFELVAQSTSPNPRLGEHYEAQISLVTYASKASMQVVIDNDTIPAIDGSVYYNIPTSKVGWHRYSVHFILTNPLTNEKETWNRNFAFEVIP